MMIRRLVVLLIATFAIPTAAYQATPDIKGFNGAEWGMTPEQVSAAFKQPLGEPSSATEGIQYKIRNFQVGDWTAGQVTFVFTRQPPSTFLSEIILDLQQYEYQPIRDELKAKYGEPTSEKLGRGDSEAIWVMPSTQLRLTRLVIGGRGFMGLYYTRRKASTF